MERGNSRPPNSVQAGCLQFAFFGVFLAFQNDPWESRFIQKDIPQRAVRFEDVDPMNINLVERGSRRIHAFGLDLLAFFAARDPAARAGAGSSLCSASAVTFMGTCGSNSFDDSPQST